MFSTIRKRDGRVEPFDAEKIARAILKAGQATGEFHDSTARKLGAMAITRVEGSVLSGVPTVEEIQDAVEDALLASPYRRTAKAYIIYRDQHASLREVVTRSHADLVNGYLEKLDWQVKENSNMTFSLQGLNNYLSSEISKAYWLNQIYPREVRDAHLRGDFHIHDLNMLSVYCVGWDLLDLLTEGFRGVDGKIESRPARHFRSALGQIVNFFYTLQGEAAGAQAFSNFDTLLAPFIRYDKLSAAEVKQALQEFVFNINVPTRVGFQTPFTNVTLDIAPPSFLRSQPVMVGGVPREETYGDFQAEMDLFNKAFLEVMEEGDARGRVFTFPIPTYNITKEFDWENPTLDRLWAITAKYGVPYFSNFVNSEMNPEDARSMCCRLRLDTTALETRGGGLFGSHPLTGSIGVVTVNMPRLGFLAKDEDDFLARLGSLMTLAKESLETKRKVLEHFTAAHLYPYTTYYLRHVKHRRGRYWDNHFSTIGLVGMNEACLHLFGENIAHDRSRAFAGRVLDRMRELLAAFQRETGSRYNLEATPAEGATYRLAQLDRKSFPGMHPETGSAPFYTNSTHLPVDFTDDPFAALDLQDDLQVKYTGGTVLHLFLKERVDDVRAIRSLVRTVCSRYRLPYFTITPTFSVCPTHGYLAGEKKSCPVCGGPTEVYSRVVGYLRPVAQWNDGKRSEFAARHCFTVKKSRDAHADRRDRSVLAD